MMIDPIRLISGLHDDLEFVDAPAETAAERPGGDGKIVVTTRKLAPGSETNLDGSATDARAPTDPQSIG